ncbi:restriction endonuclease subunit S [Bacteroides acidifaciens]|uniref:restriction endonuclease subunit S n=1 Tax=Bacteroides acidifaciens TaxID=85831 RepID=UPI00258DBBB9|nr:restriction endonuclease subunit S [Bacteroides acidifaciens]
MEQWRQDRLIDILDTLIDYRGKTPNKVDCGIPLITAKIVKNGRIDTPTEFLPTEDYNGWMVRGFPQVGDVVLTTEAPLGEVAQLTDEKIALAQRIVCLRGKEGVLDNTYLKYFFLSNIGQNRLKARETGTTVTGIKQSELKEILIDYPKIDTQKAIASVLSSLDSKIELNRRINDNLEQQAQALFKAWFVDNPKPNWSETTFSEVANFIGGYSYKGEELTDSSNIAMVTIKNFGRNGGFKADGFKGIAPFVKLKECHYANLFDILVAHTDLTQNADVIGNAELLLTYGRYDSIIFSMDLVKVLPKNNFPYRFLLAAMLKNKIFKGHCLGYVNGTTVLHLSKKALPNFEVKIPPKAEAKTMNDALAPYYQRMAEVLQENDRLIHLRDTLLPKLMSGEFNINAKSRLQ